jgi:GNAT superfamily N-acetyltransferase
MNANVVSHAAAMRIRRATADDAEALAEIGARTFFETFAADNTAEDMRLFLESTWRSDLQRAEILDAGLDTLLACDHTGAIAGFAQLRVEHPPAGIAVSAPVELKRFYVDKVWHGQGSGAHAHARLRAGSPGARSAARYGWVSGSATSARRRSIASAAFARSGRRSSSSARIRRPIT